MELELRKVCQMRFGEAWVIFNNINTDKYTDEEKAYDEHYTLQLKR